MSTRSVVLKQMIYTSLTIKLHPSEDTSKKLHPSEDTSKKFHPSEDISKTRGSWLGFLVFKEEFLG